MQSDRTSHFPLPRFVVALGIFLVGGSPPGWWRSAELARVNHRLRLWFVAGSLMVALIAMHGCSPPADPPGNEPGTASVEKDAIARRIAEMVSLIEEGDAAKFYQECLPPQVYAVLKAQPDFASQLEEFQETAAPQLLALLQSIQLTHVEIKRDEAVVPDSQAPNGAPVAFLKTGGRWYLTSADSLPSAVKQRAAEARGAVVLTWKGGVLREADLMRLRGMRSLCLRVLHELDRANSQPALANRVRPSIIPNDTTDHSIIRAMLLAWSADEFGIAVDQNTICEILAKYSTDSISADKTAAVIRSIAQELGVTEQVAIDAFSHEFKAASVNLMGWIGLNVVTTPATAHAHHVLLERRIAFEAIPFPTDDFLDRVEMQPTATQMEQLFLEHRQQLPDPVSPIPGFRRPKKISFAYLTADVEALAESLKSEISEQEIVDYYEKNRHMFSTSTIGETPTVQPLENVADQVRRLLAGLNARASIEEAFDRITSELTSYSHRLARSEILGDTNQKKPTPPDMRSLAKSHGLRHTVLPLLDQTEILDQAELSQSYTSPSMSSPGLRSFVEVAYGSDLPPMRPRSMTNSDGNPILFWKTGETEEYSPTLDQARSDVILAWKRLRARKIARQAASELAGVASPNTSLEEQFGGSHAVLKPEYCSFYRTPLSPLVRLGQGRLADGPLAGIERPGPEFRRQLFAMSKGQTGVLTNAPETTTFVIRITDELPDAELLRETFVERISGASKDSIRLPFDLLQSVFLMKSEFGNWWFQDLEDDLGVSPDMRNNEDLSSQVPADASTDAGNIAWGELLLAVISRDVPHLERIAQTHENSDIKLWAKAFSLEVQLQLQERDGLLFPNTPRAEATNTLLARAVRDYQIVIADTANSLLRRRAQFALAQVLECMSDTEQARTIYKALADEYPNRMIGKAARWYADTLDQPSMKAFCDWFFQQQLTPH